MKTIQDLIESKISHKHTNKGGWHLVTCPVCNDYKPRAGFKFDNMGENAVYHCFNNDMCGGAYNPSETNGFMSKSMKHILECFGCSELDIKELIFEYNKIYQDSSYHEKQALKQEYLPEIITLPSFFEHIDVNSNDIQHLMAFDYLEQRKIDPFSYNFMVTSNDCAPSVQKLWKNRLIIPAFYKKQPIWYQGRDMTNKMVKKYLNCSVPGSRVFFNYDYLFDSEYDVIFIFEGFMDCMSVFPFCSISCQSSNLTHEQVLALNASRKRKIVVPDMNKTGMELAQQAIDHNWEVSFPNLRGHPDLNKFVIEYGKIVATQEVLANIKHGDSAQIYIQMVKNNIHK